MSAGVAAGLNRAQAIDFVRQNPARLRRLDFESGNQKDKMQARIDRKLLVPIVARDNEAAKFGRRGVVGMAFKLGTKLEDLGALERAVEQGIEARGARPAAPLHCCRARARGHLALDRAGKCKRLRSRPRGKICGRPVAPLHRFELGSCALTVTKL